MLLRYHSINFATSKYLIITVKDNYHCKLLSDLWRAYSKKSHQTITNCLTKNAILKVYMQFSTELATKSIENYFN